MAAKSLPRVLLAATLSVTVAEFVEIQQLPTDGLRARFGLSSSCEPSVTALATDPAINVVTVAIECRSNPAGSRSPAIVPGEKPRPTGSGKKGP